MELTRSISKPTLLLNMRQVQKNIAKMAAKAEASDIHFRPHFKTHQSIAVGRRFKDYGVRKIAVSSLDMAKYFSDDGWDDITVAIPVNIRQTELINHLARRVRLNLVIESNASLDYLRQNMTSRLNVWIKIDAGYHRTGIHWQDTQSIIKIAKAIGSISMLRLDGILTHAGHTYHANSIEEIERIFYQTIDRLKYVQSQLKRENIPTAISVGDTPGCSIVDRFDNIQEIRPGNFVFYDLVQMDLGSCKEDDIAVAVACPVIAKHESRQQIIIYGGAVHLSKEFLKASDGINIYGRICNLADSGWSASYRKSYLSAVSQEHGIIQSEPELFKSVKEGDLLGVLPVHSCLTANLLGNYLTLDGEQFTMFHYRQST